MQKLMGTEIKRSQQYKMFCEKCEGQEFTLLSGITSGPVIGIEGITKSWKMYECKTCQFYKVVREETSSGGTSDTISEKNS